MKIQNCLFLAFAASLSASPLQAKNATETLQRRQFGFLGGLLSMGGFGSATLKLTNGRYGKTGGGRLPTRVEMPPSHPEVPGSKTVKIRYGPYLVPSMSTVTRTINFESEHGMLWNYPDKSIQKPCEDCMITGITADYENLRGQSVNIDSGQWLHHIVLLSTNSRADPTCQSSLLSLPHLGIDSSPTSTERFWASGNERTPIDFAAWNVTDAGYRMDRGDVLSMIVDLMNMNMEEETMYVVIKYDYVEGRPRGMSEVKPIWLDVDQCAFSEARPKSETGAYSISSSSWRTTVTGEILGMGGHLHDGGVTLRIKVDGRLVCDSRATYGGDPRYISSASHGMGGHGEAGKPHISKMVLCVKGQPELLMRQMTAGQSWTVEAEYDYSKFKGATDENGKQETVMGIALVYVRQ